jgi:hypothetical protein
MTDNISYHKRQPKRRSYVCHKVDTSDSMTTCPLRFCMKLSALMSQGQTNRKYEGQLDAGSLANDQIKGMGKNFFRTKTENYYINKLSM